MADQSPRFHVVGPNEGPRSRRPGPAVLSVLAYALLFGGALWYLRAKSPLGHRPASAPPPADARAKAASEADPAPPGAPPRSRQDLLAGAAVAPSARPEYFRHLATDRCDCGCERTLSDCLANEKSCSRSPRLAEELGGKLR